MFCFDHAELKQVMQTIGTWYNISVLFHSPALLHQRIHFRFNRKAPVAEVLQALNELGIGRVKQKNGKIVLE
ncbi:MAG: DUF4974 domain-containing protein [Bacteroides sp.]